MVGTMKESIEKAKAILAENLKENDRFKSSHARMMAEKIDVTEFIVKKLLGDENN